MATEAAQRAAVIAELMEWIGVPYHHAARVKGKDGGIDCATLLAEVFERAGIIQHVDIAHYPPDWHLHRSAERYISHILPLAAEIEAPLPGDIAMWRFGRAFGHAAIVVDPSWPAIVHADMEARCVCMARGDGGRLAGRPVRFFSPWGAR